MPNGNLCASNIDVPATQCFTYVPTSKLRFSRTHLLASQGHRPGPLCLDECLPAGHGVPGPFDPRVASPLPSFPILIIKQTLEGCDKLMVALLLHLCARFVRLC